MKNLTFNPVSTFFALRLRNSRYGFIYIFMVMVPFLLKFSTCSSKGYYFNTISGLLVVFAKYY